MIFLTLSGVATGAEREQIESACREANSAGIAEAVRRTGALYLVDTVTSLGGIPVA